MQTRRGRYHTVLRLLIFAAGFVLSLPESFWNTAPPFSPLELSWSWVLGWAFLHGLRFGSDIVFTYGPLGFLSTRLPIEGLALFYACSDLLLYGGLLAIYCIVWRRTSTLREAGALALVTLPMGSPLVLREIASVYALLSLFFLFFHARSGSLTALLAATVYAVICFFVKLNIGILCLACLCIALGIQTFRGDRRPQYYAISASVVLLFVMMASVTKTDLLGYMISSVEFFKGYNDIMWLDYRAFAGPLFRAVLIGILLLAAFLAHLQYRQLRFLALQAVALIFLFLFYKQSFVRADEWHNFAFFCFAPAAVATICFHSAEESKPIFGTVLILALVFCFQSNSVDLNGRYVMKRLAFLRDYWGSLSGKAPRIPDYSKNLSDYLLRVIGGESLDLFPGDSWFALSNDLAYRPRPVFQSYAAFTPYLAELNAHYFRSSKAPTHILYQHDCIDLRYCFGDETEAKIAILENYETSIRSDPFLLLRRRDTPAPFVRTLYAEGKRARANWMLIPEVQGLVYLRVNTSYGIWGRIRALLFQPPPVEIQFLFEDESIVRHRAGVEWLRAGVLVSPYVRNTNDVEMLFRGEPALSKRVIAVRVVADGNQIPADFEYDLQVLTRLTTDWRPVY